MSAFSLIQAECEKSIVFKKMSELEIGKHQIEKFTFVKSIFGRSFRLAIILETNSPTTKTYVGLPERFTDAVNTEEQLEDLNEGRYILNYKGQGNEMHKKKYLFTIDKVTED